MYNEKSKESIGTQFNTSIQSHGQKQVQMHEIARHLLQLRNLHQGISQNW